MGFNSHFIVFGKSQVSAMVATAMDFLVLLALVEIFSWHYALGVALGAFAGGVVNFLMNRHWSFATSEKRNRAAVFFQVKRYAMVWGGSLFWNTALVVVLTELLDWVYIIAKVVVVAGVALAWNYPLHRYWVFRDSSYSKSL